MSLSRRARLISFTLLALAVVAAIIVLPPYLSGGGAVMSLLSPGALSQPHARWEGEQGCAKCHIPSGGLSDQLCLECHAPLRARIAAGKGFHAHVEGACNDCHSEHHGLDYQQLRWPPPDRLFSPVQAGQARAVDFDHERGTGFALGGAHARGQQDCELCHRRALISSGDVLDQKQGKQGPTYLGLATDCAGCHLDPHVPTQGNDCGKCHGDEHWSPAPTFDHAQVRYPLEGKHAQVECQGCHLEPPPAAPPAPSSLPHPEFQPIAPKECPRPFRGVGFGREPAVPVQGEALPDCSSCHKNPHRGGSQAFAACRDCHTPHSWAQAEGATFDHATTGFPLDGGHAPLACAKCHGEGLGGPKRSACDACHAKDDHHRGGFDREMAISRQSCAQCHSSATWKTSTYPAQRHPLPLIEGHAVACERCHGGEARYPRLPARPPARVGPLEEACSACHEDVHKGKLGRDCAACHGFGSFHQQATLDVKGHADLGFVIAAAHLKATCEGCHGGRAPEGGLRRLALTEVRVQGCVVCHQDEHRGQLAPACVDCHGEEVWTPSGFDEARHQASRFPLHDAHRAVPCEVCHTRDLPEQKQRFRWDAERVARCASCHQDPHRGQFAQDCDACHTERAFLPSTFDAAAHAKAGFPLTGPHDTGCARCHVSGLLHGDATTYHGTPRPCAGCHEDVHQGQFADKRDGCESCHDAAGADWKPTRFDHDQARYPLRGAHRQLDCEACHARRQVSTPAGAREVAHYTPLAARECDDCHVNPHARPQAGEEGK